MRTLIEGFKPPKQSLNPWSSSMESEWMDTLVGKQQKKEPKQWLFPVANKTPSKLWRQRRDHWKRIR
ncbi:hypothetical protein GQ457_04G007850 [Hibiscus cannabinus]